MANDRTPEEERTQMLQALSLDRTNSGILESRLQYQRAEKKKAETLDVKPVEAETAKDEAESLLEEASGKTDADPEPANETPKKEPTKQEKLSQYRQDVATLKTNVVLGFWPKVKAYLETLSDRDAKTAHSRILSQLGSTANVSPREELEGLGARSHSQAQYVRPLEILSLSDVAKQVPDDSTIELLANLIKQQLPLPELFFNELKQGTVYFGLGSHEAKVKTADLLLASGLVDRATEFLPELETAVEKEDYAALNLLARYHAAAHYVEMGESHLPEAWSLCLDVIGANDAPLDQRAKALYRALALVPELEGETGDEWLAKTFAKASTEGFEILSSVGTLTAQTRDHRDPHFRLEQLKLQSAAASALLGNSDDQLKPWQEILTLYVRNWIAESDRSYEMHDANVMRPQQRYDNFGNVYYEQVSRTYRSNQIPPVEADELLKIRPDELWLELIDPPVRLDFLASASTLLLQEKDEEAAFVMLKSLATERPEKTKQLVRRMIQVWAENNNPNEQQNYQSQYYYYSRYNQVAESIPLTRSKQERNLINLSSFVSSVRSLELDDSFEE
ncbi:MAG: hypothetical protein AAF357_06290, partial [Verrucomicrobiota bacterium]